MGTGRPLGGCDVARVMPGLETEGASDSGSAWCLLVSLMMCYYCTVSYWTCGEIPTSFSGYTSWANSASFTVLQSNYN